MATRKSHNLQRNKNQATDLVLALVSFGFSYLFFSLSVDRGNLLYYLLTLVFLVYFLKFCARLLKRIYGAIFH